MQNIDQQIQQETALNPSIIYKNFHCRICGFNAVQPIVTECGHLFCWNCVHNIKYCQVCGKLLQHEQFIPIYTSYENTKRAGLQQGREAFIAPPKPKGKNRTKIKNFNPIGNQGIPLNVNLFNNLERQVLLAGSGLFPSIVVNMMGNSDQNLEQMDEEKGVKTSIKIFNFLLLIIILIGIMLS